MKRMRMLFSGLAVSVSMAHAQVPVSFDSIAGVPWENLTIERVSTLFPASPQITKGPYGHAYLLGGGCVPIGGYTYVSFKQVGVNFTFDRPDTLGVQELIAVLVYQEGAVVTPSGIDVGDHIIPLEHTEGRSFAVVRRYGEKYLEVFDKGVFYYCVPASLKRAERGKAMKVKKIGVRQDRSN